MFKLEVAESELWDGVNKEFISCKKQTLYLEHSLLSISKWEAKWHKPYLTDIAKTTEETLSYIECMITNKVYDPYVINVLTAKNINDILEYINDSHTATIIPEDPYAKKEKNKDVITSEYIYYLMVNYNIPFECEKWHVRRLLALIEICSIKNAPPKKTPKRELLKRNYELNKARRKAMNSKG